MGIGLEVGRRSQKIATAKSSASQAIRFFAAPEHGANERQTIKPIETFKTEASNDEDEVLPVNVARCPGCRGVIRLPVGMGAGQKILCPYCGVKFVLLD